MIISALLLALANAADGTPIEFCERLSNRFTANEKNMGVIWDYNVRLFRNLQKYADDVGTLEAQQEALEQKTKIYEDELAGKKKADEIVSLMLQANCPLPDHDASYLTYGKERLTDNGGQLSGDEREN